MPEPRPRCPHCHGAQLYLDAGESPPEWACLSCGWHQVPDELLEMVRVQPRRPLTRRSTRL